MGIKIKKEGTLRPLLDYANDIFLVYMQYLSIYTQYENLILYYYEVHNSSHDRVR